jgi:ABC-type bacteriocin/lantibiotic exporter with double-glycine peptidase domain
MNQTLKIITRGKAVLFLAFSLFPIQGFCDQPVTLSKEAVVLPVAFEKQEAPRLCGLAAANMVANFYGQAFDQGYQDQLKAVSEGGKGSKGILGSELLVTFRAADYDAAVFTGTLDKQETGIYLHLDKHRPLIVMITSADRTKSHYDVVSGYDPKKSLILLLDPASGPLTLSAQDFLPAWRRANCFTLLAVPKKMNTEATPIP